MSCARRREPGGLEGCAGLLVLLIGACLYLVSPVLAYAAGGGLILLVVGTEIGGRWSAICATVARALPPAAPTLVSARVHAREGAPARLPALRA